MGRSIVFQSREPRGDRREGAEDNVSIRNGGAAPDAATPPSQPLDGGLAAISLIAGYFRIAADPAQLRHQLALTGRLGGPRISPGRRTFWSSGRASSEAQSQAAWCDSSSGDPDI